MLGKGGVGSGRGSRGGRGGRCCKTSKRGEEEGGKGGAAGAQAQDKGRMESRGGREEGWRRQAGTMRRGSGGQHRAHVSGRMATEKMASQDGIEVRRSRGVKTFDRDNGQWHRL
jgi:hypothetical protein